MANPTLNKSRTRKPAPPGEQGMVHTLDHLKSSESLEKCLEYWIKCTPHVNKFPYKVCKDLRNVAKEFIFLGTFWSKYGSAIGPSH